MENNYNYIDALQSSAYRQYSSDLADTNIQTHGRKCYIFLLDKKDTTTTIYGEEKTGRIYLPHYVQRGLYKTNLFTGGLSVINFSETEENLEIEFNFDRMVKNINELKNSTSGKLTITSKAKVPLTISITKEKLKIQKNIETIFEKNLDIPIYQFIDEIKKECSLIDLKYIGNTEPSNCIEKINYRLLPRRTIDLNVFSSSYDNTTDVIENGTIIVTDRYRVYEVLGAYPTCDNFGNYISWTVKCNLVNLARVDGLPSDFNEIIKENQYGIGKINHE